MKPARLLPVSLKSLPPIACYFLRSRFEDSKFGKKHSLAHFDDTLASPSPNITLDTEVDVGVLAAEKKIKELASTVDGPFCYHYV